MTGKTRSSYPSATLSTTNPTRTALESNPYPRSDKGMCSDFTFIYLDIGYIFFLDTLKYYLK
jgi:hypothetical protein